MQQRTYRLLVVLLLITVITAIGAGAFTFGFIGARLGFAERVARIIEEAFLP
jgi:hypothetical protein